MMTKTNRDDNSIYTLIPVLNSGWVKHTVKCDSQKLMDIYTESLMENVY